MFGNVCCPNTIRKHQIKFPADRILLLEDNYSSLLSISGDSLQVYKSLITSTDTSFVHVCWTGLHYYAISNTSNTSSSIHKSNDGLNWDKIHELQHQHQGDTPSSLSFHTKPCNTCKYIFYLMTSKESNQNSNNKYKLTLYSFSHPYDPLTGSVSSFRDYSFEPIFEINTQQQHLRSHLCWDGKKILICIQDTSQNNPCLMYADSVNYFSHWTYVYPDGKSQSQGQGSSFQLNSYITTYDISF